MTASRVLFTLALAALMTACSSTPRSTTSKPPPIETTVAPAAANPEESSATTVVTFEQEATFVDTSDNSITTTHSHEVEETPVEVIATTQTDTPVTDDGKASRPFVITDPWEKMNRRTHRFNNALDRRITRPIARGYTRITPKPVRTGIGNFFKNLGSPLTMTNQLLQGHPVEASKTLGRFLLNSTLGVGGLFDPASDAKGLTRKQEDFGQTFGTWGWRKTRYLEIPFLGPRTVRDTFGLAGDYAGVPMRYLDNNTVRYSLDGLALVNLRAELLPLEDVRGDAIDDYTLIRDAWIQRRIYMIESDMRSRKNTQSLPDYMLEDEM